jgi:hypothetical protein
VRGEKPVNEHGRMLGLAIFFEIDGMQSTIFKEEEIGANCTFLSMCCLYVAIIIQLCIDENVKMFDFYTQSIDK